MATPISRLQRDLCKLQVQQNAIKCINTCSKVACKTAQVVLCPASCLLKICLISCNPTRTPGLGWCGCFNTVTWNCLLAEECDSECGITYCCLACADPCSEEDGITSQMWVSCEAPYLPPLCEKKWK